MALLYTQGLENTPSSLRVFDDFNPDRSLPKVKRRLEARHAKRMSKSKALNPGTLVPMSGDDSDLGMDVEILDGLEPGSILQEWIPGEARRRRRGRLARNFRALWSRVFGSAPEQVFHAVLANMEQLQVFKLLETRSDAAIKQAEASGQRALVETLKRAREQRRQENVLVATGITRVLSEALVLKFAANSSRALSLDFLANFMHPLPKDVLDKKAECDKLELFDNWCVLHYDPSRAASRPTVEQARKARDPILFGMLQGARKLYYVADWIDEYCDLTLTQLVTVLDEPIERL